MNKCAAEDYRKADAELNGLYKQIQLRLANNQAEAQLLSGAQRAWVAFRDAECKFSTSMSAGGSIYPMLVAACAAELTRARVDGLKKYLRCEKGDLGCPVPAR
jgi:uncharacterized protein YecT (DUF1311 family)